MNRTLTTTLAIFLGAFLLAGCSNVGDTNPISPEKMEEMRKKESADRGNFQPNGTPPPAGATTGQ